MKQAPLAQPHQKHRDAGRQMTCPRTHGQGPTVPASDIPRAFICWHLPLHIHKINMAILNEAIKWI